MNKIVSDGVLLRMQNIGKEFAGVRVLDNVNFELRKGEVHALIGANGAGKSTLMKILNGIYTKDQGLINLSGEEITFDTPRDAFEKGIGMIHQELDLVECLDVSENIFLGREIYRKRWPNTLNRKAIRAETAKILDGLGFDLPVDATVSELPPADQQLVLIARVIAMNTQVIVMDEPTSSLSVAERDNLFNVIRMLKGKGVSIVYISHYLDEVFEVADRVTVLRDGKVVTTEKIEDCTTSRIIKWMIGREIEATTSSLRKIISDDEKPTNVILSLDHLSRKKGLLKDVSLNLKKGEILGIAGVVGSGRTELVNTIIGADEIGSGQITLHGRDVRIKSAEKALGMGIAVVPENRRTEGLILSGSVRRNMSLSILDRVARFGFLRNKIIKEKVNQMIEYLKVKCNSQDEAVEVLSGGNQQKVVIGRCLLTDSDILIMDQPTRGVDVGAKTEIYELVLKQKERGMSIIYISDELGELLNLCDRIAVMKKGEIVDEYDNRSRSITKEKLLMSMVD